jgi:hypothetical protein
MRSMVEGHGPHLLTLRVGPLWTYPSTRLRLVPLPVPGRNWCYSKPSPSPNPRLPPQSPLKTSKRPCPRSRPYAPLSTHFLMASWSTILTPINGPFVLACSPVSAMPFTPSLIFPRLRDRAMPILRHCEERSDAAIQSMFAPLWIASLRSQ